MQSRLSETVGSNNQWCIKQFPSLDVSHHAHQMGIDIPSMHIQQLLLKLPYDKIVV